MNKDISNSELLEFIKENVAMKSEMATKEDLTSLATKEDLTSLATKEELKKYISKKDLADSENRVIDVIEKLSTRVKRVLDEDYPAQKKRISRVEFRTEKLLGKKLKITDADFEDKYRGEQKFAQKEANR